MAITDIFQKADVLESLSWTAMRSDVRTRKLAHLYLKKEKEIRGACRNYDGPSPRILRAFIRSYFQPARGQIGQIVEEVKAEIEVHQKKRAARASNRPYKFVAPSLNQRRDTLSRKRYSIFAKSWQNREAVRQENNCVALGAIGDLFIMVDRGSYGVWPRIYMHRKSTNEVKVLVLSNQDRDYCRSITTALSCLVPESLLRAAFRGDPVSIDFDNEGFKIGKEFLPWKVKKVYKGTFKRKKRIKTAAQPEE